MEKINSQICTSKEQSKRLLELGLKPETADMVYHYTNSRAESLRWELRAHRPTLKTTTCFNINKLNVFNHKNSDGKVMSGEEYFNELWGRDIPAWSLHRLLLLCEVTALITRDALETAYDDQINVIENLIKNGHFNKEYLKQQWIK